MLTSRDGSRPAKENETLSSKMDGRRMLVKQIIQTPADIKPDYQNNNLYITSHSIPNQRFNQAVQKLLEVLNDSKAVFSGTGLRMVFKSIVSYFTRILVFLIYICIKFS
jgi:hypothetical protein